MAYGKRAYGTVAQLPSTCQVGQYYFATNGTAGQQMYIATAVNTWSLQNGAAWGSVSGTLSAQTDLQAALDAKRAIIQPVNAQTGTTYALLAADNGKVITCTNASDVTVTVSASLGAGFNCSIVQGGAGAVILAAGVGVTINCRQAHDRVAGTKGVIHLVATAANVFYLYGDTGAAA